MIIGHGGGGSGELKVDLTPVSQYWKLVYSEGNGSTEITDNDTEIVFHPAPNTETPLNALWATDEYLTEGYEKLTIDASGHIGCWWGFSYDGNVYLTVIGIDSQGHKYVVDAIPFSKLKESGSVLGPFDMSGYEKFQLWLQAKEFIGNTCIAWIKPYYMVLSHPQYTACTSKIDYIDYKVEKGWLKIDVKSSMYPLHTSCQLVNGIVYDKGPVRQVTVYSNGKGSPVDEGYMWIEVSNSNILSTSASIPLIKEGIYNFTVITGTMLNNKITEHASYKISEKVSATVPPTTTTTETTTTTLTETKSWISKYWWIIPITAAVGLAIYFYLDPLPPIVKDLAKSKWAQDLAAAYVSPNLPPEQRQKAINEVAEYLASRMASHIASEINELKTS